MEPYRDFVDAQRERHPSLSNLCSFLAGKSQLSNTSCRIASLEVFSDGVTAKQGLQIDSLAEIIQDRTFVRKQSLGRIILVEDLSKAIIELLGQHFSIDPFFFAEHINTAAVSIGDAIPTSSVLPSFKKRRRFINAQYHRILRLPNGFIQKGRIFREMNIMRKLKLLYLVQNATIGIAQHCCSILEAHTTCGQWTYIVLVDKPINNIYLINDLSTGTRRLFINSELFQEGYEDFSEPLTPPGQSSGAPVPTRHGLYDELYHYWLKYPDVIIRSPKPSLLALSFKPLQIIAAEWTIYMKIMYFSIKHFEYRTANSSDLSPQLELLNEHLFNLQNWRRRGLATQEKLRSIIRSIQAESYDHSDQDVSGLLVEDFEFLVEQARSYAEQLNDMLPVITSLIAVVDARRSFNETTNIRKLTYLALFFIPLTYISSLFSMNDIVVPGKGAFWIYLVVAVPLTLLVFAIACLPFGVVVSPAVLLTRLCRKNVF